MARRSGHSDHHWRGAARGSISAAGLIGGGSIPEPSAVSLAYHGVRFMDKLPKFKREVRVVMRLPLEDGG
jgi:magnesium chelatase family protein